MVITMAGKNQAQRRLWCTPQQQLHRAAPRYNAARAYIHPAVHTRCQACLSAADHVRCILVFQLLQLLLRPPHCALGLWQVGWQLPVRLQLLLRYITLRHGCVHLCVELHDLPVRDLHGSASSSWREMPCCSACTPYSPAELYGGGWWTMCCGSGCASCVQSGRMQACYLDCVTSWAAASAAQLQPHTLQCVCHLCSAASGSVRAASNCLCHSCCTWFASTWQQEGRLEVYCNCASAWRCRGQPQPIYSPSARRSSPGAPPTASAAAACTAPACARWS